jgi:superfamily I DNA/RNA helicase
VPVRIGLPFVGDHGLNGDEETHRSLQLLQEHGASPGPIPDSTQFALNTNVRVLRAPDPAEEVREITRSITANLERGVPLFQQAILYGQTDPYAVLVRESLDGAGVPWSALDGQPLAETPPGRALLATVRVSQSDFAREAVLAWLTVLPERLLARICG